MGFFLSLCLFGVDLVFVFSLVLLFVCFLCICSPLSVHCSSVGSNDLFILLIQGLHNNTENPEFTIHAQSLRSCSLLFSLQTDLAHVSGYGGMYNLNSECNLLGEELYYKFATSCVYLSVYVYTFFFRRMEKSDLFMLWNCSLSLFILKITENYLKMF